MTMNFAKDSAANFRILIALLAKTLAEYLCIIL